MTTLSRKVPQVPGIEAAPSDATAGPSASMLAENKSAISDLFMGTMDST